MWVFDNNYKRIMSVLHPQHTFLWRNMSPVKRISVFEHSVMTNFNCEGLPFRWTRDLAFCLKVRLDSLLVWASSGGSGETARMRSLAWTFAGRIDDKYQICLTRSIWKSTILLISLNYHKIPKLSVLLELYMYSISVYICFSYRVHFICLSQVYIVAVYTTMHCDHF